MSAREQFILSCHPERRRRCAAGVEASAVLTQSRFLLALFCFLLLLTAFSPAQVKPWNQIQPPPLPAFKPQEPIRVPLPNGMVIFLQEDH